jgi:hypothetical protein
MMFPKHLLDPKSIEPMPKFDIFRKSIPTGAAPENCQYLGIGSMDFGSSTCFGNVIRFCMDLQITKSCLDVKILV